MVAASFAALLFGAAAAARPVHAAPDEAAHPTLPLVPCIQAQDGHPLDPGMGQCASLIDMRISNEHILAAKEAAANAYVNSLYGIGSEADVQRAEAVVRKLTGEGNADRTQVSTPKNASTAPSVDALRLKLNFFPVEQINSYYCGPATVQTILQFLGPRQSWAVDPITNRHDELTGDPQTDQRLLANHFWLGTDRNNGTNWGDAYVPFALNAWRGTRWYVQAPTANLEGGTLTKDQALRNIRYDTDHGYPVAENVLYSAETYYPAGFMPGIRYKHWDTIFGQAASDNQTYVQIGQVYHDKTTPYQRYQQVPWDIHWTAIGGWYGIVW